MRVICDTNIWYEFAKGSISISSIPENIKLVGTIFSIKELIDSPNIIYDYDLVKDAIIAMKQYSNEVIFYNCLEYLVDIDDPDFFVNPKELHKKTLITADKIANGLIIDNRDKPNVEQFLIEKRNEKKALADSFNISAQNLIKPNISDKKEHRLRFIKDNNSRTKEIINTLIKNHVKPEGLSINFNFSIIEFFIKIWQEFFIEIDVSPRKYDGNDSVDLLNLAYVGPGDKYWTMEKKWNQFAIRAKMGHYLFDY